MPLISLCIIARNEESVLGRCLDSVADLVVSLGIHAIWNFAHVDLQVLDENVVVENVHLSDSLMQLSYNIVKSHTKE